MPLETIRDNGKKLKNNITITGWLSEVEQAEVRTTQAGKNFFTWRATVVFGNTGTESLKLDGVVFETKTDDTPNPQFELLQELICKKNSITGAANKTKDELPLLTFSGSLEAADYINNDSALVEFTKYRITYVRRAETGNGKREAEVPSAKIEIEASIEKCEYAVRNGEITDELAVSFITANYRNEAVVVKGFNVPARLVSGFKKRFSEDPVNKVGLFTLGFKADVVDEVTGDDDDSFGDEEDRGTIQGGRNVLHRHVLAGTLYDPNKPKYAELFVEPKNFILMMKERQIALDALEREGYKGKKLPSTNIPDANSVSRNPSVYVAKIENGNDEDEELPF